MSCISTVLAMNRIVVETEPDSDNLGKPTEARAPRKRWPLLWALVAAALLVLGGGVIELRISQARQRAATLSALTGRIVFTSVRDNNYDIFVIDANGINETRVTISRAEDTQ